MKKYSLDVYLSLVLITVLLLATGIIGAENEVIDRIFSTLNNSFGLCLIFSNLFSRKKK